MPVATHRVRTIADKRRWTTHDAKLMVRAWRESGLSGLDFCDRFRLNQARLEKWATRVGDQPSGAGANNLAIYRAKVVANAPSVASAALVDKRIEVVLPSGISLRLDDEFNSQALSRAIQVLQC